MEKIIEANLMLTSLYSLMYIISTRRLNRYISASQAVQTRANHRRITALSYSLAVRSHIFFAALFYSSVCETIRFKIHWAEWLRFGNDGEFSV